MKKLFRLLLCMSMFAFAASCGNDPVTGDDNPGGNTDNPGGNTDNPGGNKPGGNNPTPTNDSEVNRTFTDAYMSSNYLWGEYYAPIDKDFNMSYDQFLHYGLVQMYNSSINRLDGYLSKDDNSWHFYTEIARYAAGSNPLSSEREPVRGFGMSVQAMTIDPVTGVVVLLVKYVYPDSPAEKAGLKRGTLIGKINGTTLTTGNYMNFMNEFINPHTSNINRVFNTVQANTAAGSYWYNDDNVTVSTGYYLENPIVFSQARLVRGKRIGYIVCVDFNPAYKQELLDTFSTFKTKGVTDIVVDLRYNGGGSVEASCTLASILAGAHLGAAEKPYVYYRYNNRRMVEGGYGPTYENYDYTAFENDAATQFNYNFDKVYFIVTNETAAASELVINALKGIDVPVKLIGCDYTNGKNVGIEPAMTQQPINGYDYVLAPVTFQAYNAKGESNYENGFRPDVAKSDYDKVFPVYEWGYIGYLANRDEDTGDLIPTDEMVESDYFFNAIQEIVGSDLKPKDFGSEGDEVDEPEAAEALSRSVRPSRQLLVTKLRQPSADDFRKTQMYTAPVLK